jgi:magnesium-transporting ATPase (P-type)
MSVVAHKNDVRWVFSKGAPERIAALCLQVTVPKVFEAAVTRYAKDGYRVLAFAYRPVSNSSEEKLERGDVERDLRFLGIAIFENPLKEGSQHTI